MQGTCTLLEYSLLPLQYTSEVHVVLSPVLHLRGTCRTCTTCLVWLMSECRDTWFPVTAKIKHYFNALFMGIKNLFNTSPYLKRRFSEDFHGVFNVFLFCLLCVDENQLRPVGSDEGLGPRGVRWGARAPGLRPQRRPALYVDVSGGYVTCRVVVVRSSSLSPHSLNRLFC